MKIFFLQRFQTKLTSFFPIRRSERRPKTEVEAKQQKTIEDRLLSNNDSELGLKIQYFPEKVRTSFSLHLRITYRRCLMQ